MARFILIGAAFAVAVVSCGFAQEDEGGVAQKLRAGKVSLSPRVGSSLDGRKVEAVADHARKKEIWEPNLDTSKMQIDWVRVVDFGMVNCRGFEDVHLGDKFVRGEFQVKQNVNDMSVDVDGNAATQDWVQYIPFSLEDALSPAIPQWNASATSSQFYGGFAFFYGNATVRGQAGITEQQVNANETHEIMQPANNWAMHMQNDIPESPYRAACSWIWKKENFPHLANLPGAKISFDENSRIAHFNQRYFGGWDGIRFIVKNGADFFVSEPFVNNFKTDTVVGCGGFQIREAAPLSLKWGKWTPKPGGFDIVFDPATPLALQKFDDVQAVGWYLSKDKFDAQTASCKWEAFECVANVTRPSSPSEKTDMREMNAGTNQAFYIATTETPYLLWREIYDWAAGGGQWAIYPPPSLFDRTGDMGSTDYGFLPHSPQEPATDMSLHDVLIWCNALSEYEGKVPVYYTDSEWKNPLRKAVESPWFKDAPDWKQLPVFVRWEADGYRLPTPSEWAAAAGNMISAINTAPSDSTKPVGSTAPNSFGLYDMPGNVWEMVWTYGDVLPPDYADLTVVGGAFTGCENQLDFSASPYGDKPFDGHFNIGFRLIRRELGMSAPLLGKPSALLWKISRNDVTKSATAPVTLDLPLVEIKGGAISVPGDKKARLDCTVTDFSLGKTELSWRQWKIVRDWGDANGYSFDRDGSMGSADYRLDPRERTPDEPVTDISLYDMMAWCNALSEMQKKTPVFFSDEAFKSPYRAAWRYRPANYRGPDGSDSFQQEAFTWTISGKTKTPVFYRFSNPRDTHSWANAPRRVYMKWDSDGYRPPTMAEWSFAYAAGSKAAYPWGDDYANYSDYGWFYGNSMRRTHPVATKKPNAYGLFDMAGNVLEFCIDSDRKGSKPKTQRTENPLGWMTPYEFNARWRATFCRTGFDYDAEKYVRTNALADSVGDNWGGAEPGWHWPDIGFRIASNPNYPANALSSASESTGKALPVTPLNLDRKAGDDK